ncbi:hypothetical protein J7E62_07970 [Variovorax paradoxus]|nr:hypothetical protein [Variovorax paradoxus]
MNRFTLLPLALVIAGCSTPSPEVVPLRDGVLRAPSYVDASNHCRRQGATARMLGKAPGETGINFRCE